MCLFCKIVEGEIPSNKVYEDDDVYAFRDINPVAPTHILVIPKEHISSLNHIETKHQALLGRIQIVAMEIAKSEGIASTGYRVVNNCGHNGGQTVDHLHYHLIGGASFGWPPFPK